VCPSLYLLPVLLDTTNVLKAWFFLSSNKEWGLSDNTFSYNVFYKNIVILFEDDLEDPWVIEMLEWWNECIDPMS